MIRMRCAGCGITLSLGALLIGCQQPQGNMADMMKPPPRAAELDRLDMLVGRWEGTYTMRMPGADKEMTGKGTNTSTWEADKRVLVERSEGTMGDEGKFSGLGIWAWDSQAKVFHQSWFDSHGSIGTGTATYNEATKTWHMQGHGSGPQGQTVSQGTAKMLDANTMEWNYTEWDNLKLRKLFEMKGTSKRKT